MNQSGRCQCGNVNYYFDKEKVISAHHCHCKDCQRTTGCGKATVLYIASKNITPVAIVKGMALLINFLSPDLKDLSSSKIREIECLIE